MNIFSWELLKLLLPSFLGAFFAFLFIRFADWLKEKHEIKKKNIRSLLKIQFICNENSNSINNTVFSIDQINRVIKESKERLQVPLAGNRLEKMILEKDVLLDLLNQDFINDFFSYNATIEKHNEDVVAFNELHDSLKMAFISKKIDSENYWENIERLKSNLEVFKKFCNDSFEKNEDILSKCRVLLITEQTFFRKLFKSNYRKYNKDFDSKVSIEKQKLIKEMKFVQEKSKQEIDKVMNQG